MNILTSIHSSAFRYPPPSAVPNLWFVAGETTERKTGSSITTVGLSLVDSYSGKKAYVNNTNATIGYLEFPGVISHTTRIWSVAMAFGAIDTSMASKSVQCPLFMQGAEYDVSSNFVNHAISYLGSTTSIVIDEFSPSGGSATFTANLKTLLENGGVLVIVHDNVNAKMYVNGALYDTKAHSEIYSSTTPTHCLFLARNTAWQDRSVTGVELCAGAVYDTTLTLAQVQSLTFASLTA